MLVVALLPLFLSGCDEQYPLDLTVENWTDRPETLTLLIHAQNGTLLYDETFHMDPQSRTGWFQPDIPQGVHPLTVVWRDASFEVTRRFQDGEGGVAVAVFPDRLEITGGGDIDQFEHPPRTDG